MTVINNEDRTLAALMAMKAFYNVRGVPVPLDSTDGMEEAIVALISNLCHLAARHEIPPLIMLESAAENYAAEAVRDEGTFLELKVALNVQARRYGSDEPYQTFNDESAALWRASANPKHEPEVLKKLKPRGEG